MNLLFLLITCARNVQCTALCDAMLCYGMVWYEPWYSRGIWLCLMSQVIKSKTLPRWITAHDSTHWPQCFPCRDTAPLSSMNSELLSTWYRTTLWFDTAQHLLPWWDVFSNRMRVHGDFWQWVVVSSDHPVAYCSTNTKIKKYWDTQIIFLILLEENLQREYVLMSFKTAES